MPLYLTDHTGVFAFDQGVVVAFPEPGLGRFDVQSFEQTGHPAIDVFRAGADMEADDGERESFQQFLQYR